MAGVVPPIRPGATGSDIDRSPYRVSMPEMVQAFALSNERATIISGLLEFREALHNLGITTGFQWVNGSFLENIEDLEGRPPNDIDVVTFFEVPSGQTQASLLSTDQALFERDQTKANFNVDAFWFVLNQPVTEPMVRQVSYWYSMWSHRRDEAWKGFAQIDLNPSGDAESRALLTQMVAAGFEK